MPNVTPAEKRQKGIPEKQGQWHRIRKLSEGGQPHPEHVIGTRNGTDTIVKVREKGGLLIGQGKTYILLDVAETANLIQLGAQLIATTRTPEGTP
jgi:hypothetical protein